MRINDRIFRINGYFTVHGMRDVMHQHSVMWCMIVMMYERVRLGTRPSIWWWMNDGILRIPRFQQQKTGLVADQFQSALQHQWHWIWVMLWPLTSQLSTLIALVVKRTNLEMIQQTLSCFICLHALLHCDACDHALFSSLQKCKTQKLSCLGLIFSCCNIRLFVQMIACLPNLLNFQTFQMCHPSERSPCVTKQPQCSKHLLQKWQFWKHTLQRWIVTSSQLQPFFAEIFGALCWRTSTNDFSDLQTVVLDFQLFAPNVTFVVSSGTWWARVRQGSVSNLNPCIWRHGTIIDDSTLFDIALACHEEPINFWDHSGCPCDNPVAEACHGFPLEICCSLRRQLQRLVTSTLHFVESVKCAMPWFACDWLCIEHPHAGLTGSWLIHKRCASQRVGLVATSPTLHKW